MAPRFVPNAGTRTGTAYPKGQGLLVQSTLSPKRVPRLSFRAGVRYSRSGELEGCFLPLLLVRSQVGALVSTEHLQAGLSSAVASPLRLHYALACSVTHYPWVG